MAISDDYKDALDLVDEAIEFTRNALDDHPPLNEKRLLQDALDALNIKRGVLQARFNQAKNAATAVVGPTPDQIARVATLSNEVESATRDALVASASVALATKVLDLATSIVG